MIISRIKNDSGLLKILSLLPKSYYNYFYLTFASLFINISALALPIMLIQVYDRIIANSALGSLSWLVIGCFTALLIENILRTFRSFLSGWLAASFENELNKNIIEKILYSRKRDFDAVPIGEHLERISSVSTLKSVYSGQIFQFFMDIPFAFLYLCLIAFLAGKVVIIPVICILVYYFLLLILKPHVTNLRQNQKKSEEIKNSKLINILSKIFSVKALAMEEAMLRRYGENISINTKNENKLNYWQNILTAFAAIIPQISLFGVVIYGGIFVIDGKFTLGIITACIILAGRAISPFIEVGNFWFRKSEIQQATERITDVADMVHEREVENEAMGKFIYGLIELKDISFKYDYYSKNYLLKDLNLKIYRKEFITVECSSDISSTLSNIILGRLKPTTGYSFIDGFKASEWNIRTVNDSIKYFSRKTAIFNGTVLENLTVFNTNKIKAAYEAAKMMELDHYVANMPKGYETQLNIKSSQTIPSTLLHRITLTRAFVNKPRIVIFDHFDEVLDSETEKLLIWLLNKLKGSLTIVAFTKNASIKKISNRNIIINQTKAS